MPEQLKPVLWLRRLSGAECHADGRCYDIAFCKTSCHEPLYAIPAACVVMPRSLLRALLDGDSNVSCVAAVELRGLLEQ